MGKMMKQNPGWMATGLFIGTRRRQQEGRGIGTPIEYEKERTMP
jgi:hypothetical protein